jgi:hypothetical protein
MLGPSSTGRCVVGGQVDPEDLGELGTDGLDINLATDGDARPPAPPQLRYAQSQPPREPDAFAMVRRFCTAAPSGKFV